MKKVILNKEVDTINASELDDSWFVGAEQSGVKFQLIRYDLGIWFWLDWNNYCGVHRKTHGTLGYALEFAFHAGSKLYATKDASEFKKWLLAE